MKTNLIVLLMLFLQSSLVNAQDTIAERKLSIPIGIFTSDNRDIYGLSVGIGSDLYMDSEAVGVRSNGIRIEPLSSSLLIATLFFGPEEVRYPKKQEEFEAFAQKVPNEIINGINLSCGTNAFANVNGITVSALLQSFKDTNGISITGLGSGSFRNNGIQLAGAGTYATYSNGLILSLMNTEINTGTGIQIGAFNHYVNFTGLQLGMCNDINSQAQKFTGLQIGIYNRTKKLKGIQLGLINVNEKRTLPFINWNFKN